MNKTEIEWHPYPQEKPREEGAYLITTKDCRDSRLLSSVDTFFDKGKIFGIEEYDPFDKVIAWAEMPKPYKDEI